MNELFYKYQPQLLKLANNRFGRKFLGIDSKDKIIALSDNVYCTEKGNKFKAVFRTYPLFYRKLYYALNAIDLIKNPKDIYTGLSSYKGLLNYCGLLNDNHFPLIMLASGDPIYSSAGDGVVYTVGNANWATAHSGGGTIDHADTSTVNILASIEGNSSAVYIDRGMFPYDTSAIAAGNVVSAATHTVTCNEASTGASFNVALVQTTQASLSSLENTDFTRVTWGTRGATDAARPSGAGATLVHTLNATGLGWIGVGASATAKLALLASFDADDSEGGYGQYWYCRLSEYASTTSDPILTVTYALGGGGPVGWKSLLGVGQG